MKLKECKNCYYAGQEKCFFYDEEYKNLKKTECCEGFIDPYDLEINTVGEICKNCHYYQTNQCSGNELAKENCILNY